MLKIKEWIEAKNLSAQFTVMENQVPISYSSKLNMTYNVATRIKDNKDFILFQTLKRHSSDEYEIDIFPGKFHDDLKNVSIVSYFSNVNEDLGRIYDSSDCEINNIESEIELLIKKTLERIKKINDAED